MIRFILNNKTVQTDLPSGSTLLDYIRYTKLLFGTKIGCREGDCGACTVLVGDFEHGKLRYRNMTSCLMPLGNAHGKHILTVEGINLNEALSPAQQAMVTAMGTQCGFCTIGFVMSLTGFVLDEKTKTAPEAICAMDGNICRCTGYKSIERAADLLAKELAEKPQENTLFWLVENKFVPNYMLSIPQKLKDLQAEINNNISDKEGIIMGGGTDLMVQKPEFIKKSTLNYVYDNNELKGIYLDKNGQCILGASVTVTEFSESKTIQDIFPNLQKYISLVSSTPIRNMATMAGNFVNASPIGDMTCFFLGLNASIVLKNKHTQSTRYQLLSQFYKGYKQLDKTNEEYIEQIIFTPPSKDTYFNFEKVSKRTNLDIASVNSTCQLKLDNNIITTIHLAVGGVAATPKYLFKTVEFLQNKPLTEENIQTALEIMNSEIAPISDARGTSDYKRLLARQFVAAHLLEFVGQDFGILG